MNHQITESEADFMVSQKAIPSRKQLGGSHDRFLIIDQAVYHIGASLKDLGKKWFAFSKMDPKPLASGRNPNLDEGFNLHWNPL